MVEPKPKGWALNESGKLKEHLEFQLPEGHPDAIVECHWAVGHEGVAPGRFGGMLEAIENLPSVRED